MENRIHDVMYSVRLGGLQDISSVGHVYTRVPMNSTTWYRIAKGIVLAEMSSVLLNCTSRYSRTKHANQLLLISASAYAVNAVTKIGEKGSVLSKVRVLYNSEKTPHLYIDVKPITDGNPICFTFSNNVNLEFLTTQIPIESPDEGYTVDEYSL